MLKGKEEAVAIIMTAMTNHRTAKLHNINPSIKPIRQKKIAPGCATLGTIPVKGKSCLATFPSTIILLQS